MTTHTADGGRLEEENTDIVEVPVKPPRKAECYRTTKHFKQRLRERVPSFHRGPVPAEIIEEGAVTRRTWRAPQHADNPGQPVAFTSTVDGRRYTVIAALRPGGYRSTEVKHTVLTVYEGDPPAGDAGDVTDTRGDRR